MVCDGPEPPEDSLGTVTPPPDSLLPVDATTDSDEEMSDYAGYQPLPQGPDGFLYATGPYPDEDEAVSEGAEAASAPDDAPPTESVDRQIAREVWSAPRPHDPIQMDSERAQQVMSAMANFVLPRTSIPEWAQSVSEEQWKQRLQDKIETMRAKP